MLLRIQISESSGRSTLCVQGRLTRAGLGELDRAYACCALPVELDLGDLLSVDDAGTAYLHGLVGVGVPVRRASAYIAELLKVGSGAGS